MTKLLASLAILLAADYTGANPRPKMWPGGRVPYVISGYKGFPPVEKAMIAEAFKQFEDNTCIRMVQKSGNEHYIEIGKFGGGIWSTVGRWIFRNEKGESFQPLSLDHEDPLHTYIVTHTIMMALGFWYEHQREDRDKYIQIKWDNIKPRYKGAFRKQRGLLGLEELPYDIESVMHLRPWAFSKNGKKTMVALQGGKDVRGLPIMGQYNKKVDERGLSPLDIVKINTLYNCTVKPEEATTGETEAETESPEYTTCTDDILCSAETETFCVRLDKCGGANQTHLAVYDTCGWDGQYQAPKICCSDTSILPEDMDYYD